MAIHVYMSVGKTTAGGKLIDPETKEETMVMRYRGEVGINDDHLSFKNKMESKGHVVEFQSEVKGEIVEREFGTNSIQRSYEYKLGDV